MLWNMRVPVIPIVAVRFERPPKACGVMVKAMDCGIVVSEFVPKSRYYVHFRANTLRKGMDPLILQAMGLIVPQLFF